MTGDGYPAGADPVDGVQLVGSLWAGWVLYPDGAWPWLLDAAGANGPGTCGCACPRCAPHEQPGPLPAAYRAARW